MLPGYKSKITAVAVFCPLMLAAPLAWAQKETSDSPRHTEDRSVGRVAVIADDSDAGPAYFVSRALNPNPDDDGGIAVDTFAPADLTAEKANDYAVFFLVDVARPSEKLAEFVHRRVQQGAGVCVMLGPRANLKMYRRNFYRMAGELLPVVPTKLVRPRAEEGESPAIQFAKHPIGRLFDNGGGRILLARAIVRKHYTTDLVGVEEVEQRADGAEESDDAKEGDWRGDVRVVARVGGAPLMLERRIGKGRVLAVHLSPEREWTNWMLQPGWVLFMLGAREYLAGQHVGDASGQLSLPREIRREAEQPRGGGKKKK